MNVNIRANVNEEIRIVCIGCAHHGAAGADEQQLNFWYNKILNTPNMYAIFLGDMVDAIYEKDKRYTEEEVADWCWGKKWGGTIIDRQFNYAVEKWSPLAKAGKILWIHMGNHEEKLIAVASRDLTRDWSRVLSIPYAGYMALTNLRILHDGPFDPKARKRPGRDNSYSRSTRVVFFTTHGAGGAQSQGAVMNKVSAMMDNYEANVYLMAHLHKRMSIARRTIGITEPRTSGGKLIRPRRRVYDRVAAVCGTFMDGHCDGVAGYGERKGYSPIITGPSVIHIKVEHNTSSRKFVDNETPRWATRIWVSDAVVEERK